MGTWSQQQEVRKETKKEIRLEKKNWLVIFLIFRSFHLLDL